MNARERTLAVLLSGLAAVGAAAAGGYLLVYEPVQAKRAAAGKLADEVEQLRGKHAQYRKDQVRLAEARRRSLPPDLGLAGPDYNEMMVRLLRRAGVTAGAKVSSGTPDNRGVPLLPGAAKKPVYTKVVSNIEFGKADMWAVKEFLEGYYKLGLLHQITGLSVRRDDSRGGTDSRNNLAVKVTSEALILDGAESRLTLLPVPTAFGAVGGLAAHSALSHSRDAGRGLTPMVFAPVLATKGRDYGFLAVKDMFHGPLPPPRPLSVDKIPEVVVKLGDPVGPVPVPVGGDAAYLGRITLTAAAPADSPLLPADAVVVDSAGKTVTVTPAEGEVGSAVVTVVARSQTGQEVRSSFRLTVEAPKAPPAKEDITPFVLLVGVSTGSDGTASAVVRDTANRLKYEVEAVRKRVKVTKFWFVGATKKKDQDYDTPDELLISDGTSSTRRRFKVVAVDEAGLVVQDLDPAAEKEPADKKGKGERGRVEKAPPPKPAKPVAPSDAPVEPKPADAATPALLRWTVGKSLGGLTPVPPDEARRILDRAAERGPVGATAAAPAGGPAGN